MIARHEAQVAHSDVWTKLAAPLPSGVIFWRQDGRPITRDGKHFARFLAYIEANTVRERLDAVVPGEWSLTLELLPPLASTEDGGEGGSCSFKARLQILGVVREDVGTGRDYKLASTDAFKRVAVRFGIGHELYALDQNWVAMDGEGKSAKPLEDPQAAYERRKGRGSAAASAATPAAVKVAHAPTAADDATAAPASLPFPRAATIVNDVPPCPKCGGRMWDNRIGKRNPKAPDFKCRDRSCDGVIWPPKGGAKQTVAEPAIDREPVPAPAPAETSASAATDDDVPF